MSRTKALMGSLATLVVLAGLYGALAISLSSRVPSDVTVDGVKVGDLSAQQATATLRRALADRVRRPMHLRMQARSVDIAPGPAGLDADVGATVADLTGLTVNPVRLWSRVTGKRDRSFTVRIDHGKLIAALSKAVRSLDRPVKEGSVEFSHGKATAVLPVAGTKVDVARTADAVVSAWPRRQVVAVVAKVTPPTVSAAEIRRATREFASSEMSAPVTVRTGADLAAITLAPRQYAPALSTFADRAGKLHLRIDTPKLMAAIRAAAPGLETHAIDATVDLIAGKVRVVPATAGTTFDPKATSAKFRAALTSSSRSVTTRLVPASPAVTTAIAQGWGIKGAISTFTTQFPVNAPRTNNIKLAVATLNGTLVRAGDQFSLNTALGQRTSAKGYQRAPVINDGRLIEDFGGGVSQVSTTTFNAAFFAGVKLDQHTPHSFFIARYPEGREATVSWPDVDQKWTNDTDTAIVIKAYVRGNNVTVTLLGVRKWDVAAVKGVRRNVVPPKVIVDARPTCVPQLPTPGFDVTVAQIFNRDGVQVRRVLLNTHYIPEDNVKCTHPAPKG